MERLQEIFNCIEKCEVVADIGCDHGKLEGMLLSAGRANRVIATDISEKSLGKAIKACKCPAFEERVDFRRGDGLSVLVPGEADAIVIAGIGGLQISDILKSGADVAKAAGLVLCPHSHEARLREFLLTGGYRIKRESLSLEDGRYYQIICARFDGKKRSERDGFYYEIGRGLLSSGHPLLKSYLKSRLSKTDGIIKNAAQSDKPDAKRRKKKLEAFADRLEELLR